MQVIPSTPMNTWVDVGANTGYITSDFRDSDATFEVRVGGDINGPERYSLHSMRLLHANSTWADADGSKDCYYYEDGFYFAIGMCISVMLWLNTVITFKPFHRAMMAHLC